MVTQPPPLVNVTAAPIVVQDLALAERYLQAIDPTAANPCVAITVDVAPTNAPILAGAADNGVWTTGDFAAAPVLDGCTIVLSRFLYGVMAGGYPHTYIALPASHEACESFAGIAQCSIYHRARGHWARTWGCEAIAHEYSHLVGLDDTAHGFNIQRADGVWSDPLCSSA